ncbi:uncharacterized protein LOC135103561 isoform X2 [Scylla paramamosain]|uniref:uncharacterized protein LOC135103561 isoform X2 n=1 Tax=Scylla paramamosain TaxID=85552 RepID=UPI0030829926
MVLLWTQHEGERVEPQPTDDHVQEVRKDGGVNGAGKHPHPHRLPHAKDKPAGDAAGTKAGTSNTASPSGRSETLRIATPSEKHVVTLRQISEVFDATKSSITSSPTSLSSSPSSPSSSTVSPSTPSASSTPLGTVVEVERLEDGGIGVESVAKVEKVSKVSTLGLNSRLLLEEEEQDGEEGVEAAKKKRSQKRKFYTLPRNWRSKATDFILTKGKMETRCAEREREGREERED